MTIRTILKNGVSFDTQCRGVEIDRNSYGVVTRLNWLDVTENQPVLLYLENVAAIIRLVGDEEPIDSNETPIIPSDKGEAIINEALEFYKKHKHTKTKNDWEKLHTDTERLCEKYDESSFLLTLLKETSKYIERSMQCAME